VGSRTEGQAIPVKGAAIAARYWDPLKSFRLKKIQSYHQQRRRLNGIFGRFFINKFFLKKTGAKN
jgi:hypothetical protein